MTLRITEGAVTSAAPEAEGVEPSWLAGFPPSGSASVAQVRQMSKVLFQRLAALEEGTREYQYVRGTLIELNTTLVNFAAKKFGNRPDQMEDILQVGMIGLIKAVDRYDLAYGTEFTTFAIPTIVGEIKRFFRDTSWSVHVPRRLQEMRVDLAKANDLLVFELGRTPTTAELADRLGLDLEEVVEAQIAANAYTTDSIDVGAGAEDDEGTSWGRRIGFEDPAYEGAENLSALKPLMAALPERDRRILAMRFGADMTQAQIGAELGLSQMQISRLLNTALRKLRRGLLTED
ncbi:RNA polymerase sigma factor SigF [Streptomyces sp. SL13]|uniref:RNA polymerase sigma factor SigF n=1 Tax=Streptantibioticus silvisoli TaxID=2705255 RepID=A0AA90KC53_9ACTN|nr:RNA polymerase sigma factor SigF [Streptantibioticus silvisoli]MDI5974533.1 RNA polymerase sigma factor SigF [Streptantibioticus silvisoli]